MIALMQALAAPTAGIRLLFANTALSVSDLYERIRGAAVSVFGIVGIEWHRVKDRRPCVEGGSIPGWSTVGAGAEKTTNPSDSGQDLNL